MDDLVLAGPTTRILRSLRGFHVATESPSRATPSQAQKESDRTERHPCLPSDSTEGSVKCTSTVVDELCEGPCGKRLPPARPPPSSRTRLHGFSFPPFSWGTHRLLRCTKNGSASAPPPAAPDTPSLDKEKPHRRESGGEASAPPAAAVEPAHPPRPVGSDYVDEEVAESAPPPAAESKKRGFSIVLSKQEIAQDFAAIRGTRPPRRPKKRARVVQRQLDT